MTNLDDIQPIKFSENKKIIGNRWKSKVVWTSSFSLLLIILGSLGLYEKIGITEDKAKAIADSVLVLLGIFGVINDPTNSKGF